MKKHIIWQSDFNVEDFRDYLEEYHPEIEDDYEQFLCVAQLVDVYMDDERMNLDIPCDIIALADLGRWNGRFKGFKLLNNINEIFDTDREMACFFVEGRHLQAILSDHDGTTYITYLEIKRDAPDSFRDQLKYGNYPTPSQIRRYCRALGRTVRNVYGW